MSWDDFVARHNVGDVVAGTVTRLTPFGVFLTVSGDVPGLLVTRDRPSVGSTVTVRIQALDPHNRRVAFS
ncbi:S1 RNA-binding domain-containing protein [Dactylosporangium sp. CS-047395]|uniref:S1 RNA-binding domain-containing protein n=1 Tax=Dactylosporangium sp. CS-047395 TaxID=3239936 RepID=UPI003D8B9922